MYRTNDTLNGILSAQPIVEDLETTDKYEVDPEVFAILAYAGDGVSERSLVAFVSAAFDTTESAAEGFLDSLESRGLLTTESSDPAGRAWREAGWDRAFEYFQYIRNYPYLLESAEEMDEYMDREAALMDEYTDQSRPPSVYRHRDGDERVPLPDPEPAEASLPTVGELVTGTVPSGSIAEASRSELSTLLGLAFGETGRLELDTQSPEPHGEFILKTSPSGGSRHPTEAYLIARDVAGIPDGVFHYSVADHALDRVADADGSIGDGEPLSVVFTSVLERSMWRYREPRTYRVILHDIGHVCETLRLIAAGYGYDARFEFGFDQPAIERLLGVDPFDEPAFAAGHVQ